MSQVWTSHNQPFVGSALAPEPPRGSVHAWRNVAAHPAAAVYLTVCPDLRNLPGYERKRRKTQLGVKTRFGVRTDVDDQ